MLAKKSSRGGHTMQSLLRKCDALMGKIPLESVREECEQTLKIASSCGQILNSVFGRSELPALKTKLTTEEQKSSELKSKVDLSLIDSSSSSSNLSSHDPAYSESLSSEEIDISLDMTKSIDSTSQLDLSASKNMETFSPEEQKNAVLESPLNHEQIIEGYVKLCDINTQTIELEAQQISKWKSTGEDLKPTEQTSQVRTPAYAYSQFKNDYSVRTLAYAKNLIGKSLDRNISDVRTHAYGKINKIIYLFNGGSKYPKHSKNGKKRSRINKSTEKWKQRKRNKNKIYNKFSAISENGAKRVKHVYELKVSPDFLNAIHKIIIILKMKSDVNATLTMPETRRMKVRARGMKIIDIREEKGLCEIEFLMEEDDTRNVLLLSATQDQPIFNEYKKKSTTTHSSVEQPELARVPNGGRNLTVLLSNIVVLLVTLAMSMYPKFEVWMKGHISN